jgi:hypothetical protein
MKHAYYESEWKHDDLNDKTVQFSLPTQFGHISDVGTFRIHIHDDLIAVCICVARPGGENIHSLWDPSLVDKIEVHPDQSIANFRLGL